jgi:hypothetical protein
MRPYSHDCRLKVVRAHESSEGAQRDLARLFVFRQAINLPEESKISGMSGLFFMG